MEVITNFNKTASDRFCFAHCEAQQNCVDRVMQLAENHFPTMKSAGSLRLDGILRRLLRIARERGCDVTHKQGGRQADTVHAGDKTAPSQGVGKS